MVQGTTNEYRIGTVSRLTGVDAHTIRAWERRHAALRPRRSEGGTRLYGDPEIERLRLLKAVTDAGDSIGVVAHLADEELRQRLANLAGLDAEPARTPKRELSLAVLGEHVAMQLETLRGVHARVVVAEQSESLFRAASQGHRLDIVVMQLTSMGDEPVRLLRSLLGSIETRLVVIVYEFARRRTLNALAQHGAKLVRGPHGAAQLQRSIFDLYAASEVHRRRVPAPESEDVAERVFDDLQLVQLREIQSAVECECPNHLASLVQNLVAFEAYAKRCVVDSPEDAVLHQRLAEQTGHARARMEQLLVELCEHDEIAV